MASATVKYDDEVEFFCEIADQKLQNSEDNNEVQVDISSWTNEDVVEWVCGLNEDYETYREIFENSGWTGENLMKFKKKELMKLGIMGEHGQDIKTAVKQLKAGARMEEEPTIMHGLMGLNESDWVAPRISVFCPEKSRSDYTDILAHEYEDDPATLRAKVTKLAEMINNSENACVYTGAGLSTSAGISDYASRATNSVINKNRAKPRAPKSALPSLGHRVLANLAEKNKIKHWVQQNHDGLPQKAGFPQHRINEVHGAWFDPSNTVVPMSGTLRSDLFDWMEDIANETDLCIAVGTSLSGMSADQTFETPATEYAENGVGFGGVIISIQRTQLDDKASLRIYSKIDQVMALLAKEMELTDLRPCKAYKLNIPKEKKAGKDRFLVPYDRDGNLTEDPSEMIVWDLRVGKRMKVTAGAGVGFEGNVKAKYGVHYVINLPCQYQKKDRFGKGIKGYTMGAWWVQTAVNGLWPKLPVVNVSPKLQCERKTKKKN